MTNREIRDEIAERFPAKTFGVVNVRMQIDLHEDCQDILRTDSKHRSICGHEKWDDHDWERGEWEFYLDHSCDEWIIGGISQAKSFRTNLNDAIAYAESRR